MSFLHPEFFYFMLLPLLLLFGLLLTQKEINANFFSEEVMAKLRVHSGALSLRSRNILFFFIALLLLTSLAQPVIKEGEIEVKAKSADLMLGLDISDSMLAEDIYPNRLRVAKEKALFLIESMENERIGVLAFAKNSYLVSPLSFDSGAVKFLLHKLDTNSITEKGTDFLSMLEVVAKSSEAKKQKYLLILSDGGDQSDFSQEISYAKEHDITIFVLAVATQKGAPIRLENGEFIKHKGDIIISKRNDTIAKLATSTGGVYIQSTRSNEDIKTMISEIKGVAKEEELQSQKIQKYFQLFYIPLGFALFLLLLATSSMSKREVVQLPSAFLLFFLLMSPARSEAGILDFQVLQDAKEAYEKGEYEEAARLYGSYAKEHSNDESHYNAANALYKQGKYEEAIEHYKDANFDTKVQQSQKYANMGNAYAKQGSPETLSQAVSMYENSLKLHEDKEVQENLQRVKEMLQKQKEQEQQQQDKQQNDKNEKNQKNDQEENQEQNEKQEGEQDNEKKDSDSQEQSSQEEEQKQQEQQQEEQRSKDETQEQEQKQKQSEPQEPLEAQEVQMSDAEQKKWLDALNKETSSFMYQLNKTTKQEPRSDEKPW
ncbi:MAG: VWA domain-containing protein [Sulfurimonas sp.]|jgi:Ca-activated chloride channel family protein|nr:VWA domain-containing protein [Sulfurimonas sp.]